MGIDIHRAREDRGQLDHNPACKGGSHRSREAGRTPFVAEKKPWWYWKAKAQARKREHQEAYE